MKKISSIVAALIFISFSAISQQINNTNVSYANNGVKIEPNSSVQIYIVGNPVKNTITLQISNPNSTQYELVLYNSNGAKVTTMLYDHPAGVSTKSIDVSNVPAGMYFLVANSNSYRKTLQVMVTQ